MKIGCIVSGVSGPSEVRDVMTGLLGAVASGTIVLETSTIGPAQSRALADRGATCLDAPVSGGVQAAREDKLTVMLRGDERAFDWALPVLRCIGSDILHLGPSGSGNAAKLFNQIVYLSYTAPLCEGVALGGSSGLGSEAPLDALSSSTAGRPLATGWHEQLRAGDLVPGVAAARVVKDIRLGRDLREQVNVATPVFEAALDQFERARQLGYADSDRTDLRRIALGYDRMARG
jgi:3-hydroxyisobutyrate dehydrogenase